MGDSDKKLMLLTGGNSGIGLEAVKVLCARGHKLIVTVRSEEKGEHCLREVKAITPDADINYMFCEMTDLSSVRNLAAEFKKTRLADGQLLDVLINNAGGMFYSNRRTMCEANPTWEKTFATNAIAPILLTDLLIDNLKETAAKKGDARVVMVNSSVITYKLVSYITDLQDIMIAKPKAYTNGTQTYKNSKASLLLATQAMVTELAGSGVTINSLCPGVIPRTNLSYANTPAWKCTCAKFYACCCGCCVGESNEKGGSYIVQVADDEQGKSQGLFYLRGSMMALPPQCLGGDRQTSMLQILRDLVKDTESQTSAP